MVLKHFEVILVIVDAGCLGKGAVTATDKVADMHGRRKHANLVEKNIKRKS